MRIATGVLICLLGLTACQSGADTATPAPASSSPSVSPAPTPSLTPAQRLVGVLKETSDLKAELITLRDQLTIKCMEAKGFHTHPTTVEKPEPFVSPLPDPKQWQLDSAKVAKEGYGYGTLVLHPVNTANGTTPPPSAFDNLPAAERDSYLETRDGSTGCAIRVRIIIYGDTAAPPPHTGPSMGALITTPVAQAAADKRVKSMMSAWSGCMSGKGYGGLKTTDQAIKMAMYRYGAHGENPVYSAGNQQKEIKQATGDLACRTKVKMVSVMVSVTTEKVTALLLKNEKYITGWRDEAKAEVDRAKAALAKV